MVETPRHPCGSGDLRPTPRLSACSGALRHAEAWAQRFKQAEFRQDGAQPLGGAALFLAGVARDDQLVLHAVLPAHQLGHGHLVATGFQIQAAQHVGQLAAQLARVQGVAPQLGQRRARQLQGLGLAQAGGQFGLSDDAKRKGPIKGIILDLRNNPGGLLDQAVSVSDAFLDKGTIVSIKGRRENTERVYTAKKQGDDVRVPMVVLINAGSASASEIVAGALRDQKRALIVGERSFGKGSVQNIIPLADGSGLKLTVALYYTPNGSSIQAEGIVPDLEIPFEAPRNDDKDNPRMMLREQDLNRHIENGKDKKSSKAKNGKEDAAEQLARDNQLRMALQMVKSLPKMREIRN